MTRLSRPMAVPKPRPVKVERAERRAARAAVERAENAQVKARSGGQCEVYWTPADAAVVPSRTVSWRCPNRAVHVHHMIGGRGRRGIGISTLAEHKQAVCDQCHRDITGEIGGKRLILQQGGPIPVWTDMYQRVR